MRNITSLFCLVTGCIALVLLSGCFASPKPHAWQVSRENLPQNAGAWNPLPAKDYQRVIDSKHQEAVALLQDHAFLQLDGSQVSALAPELTFSTGKAYLVRGTSFSSLPAFTIVRFDTNTGRLLVQQFTYNGEMLMPFRWVAEPNALVVSLPQPPTHVYPDAVLGGDLIFRGKDWKTLDRR